MQLSRLNNKGEEANASAKLAIFLVRWRSGLDVCIFFVSGRAKPIQFDIPRINGSQMSHRYLGVIMREALLHDPDAAAGVSLELAWSSRHGLRIFPYLRARPISRGRTVKDRGPIFTEVAKTRSRERSCATWAALGGASWLRHRHSTNCSRHWCVCPVARPQCQRAKCRPYTDAKCRTWSWLMGFGEDRLSESYDALGRCGPGVKRSTRCKECPYRSSSPPSDPPRRGSMSSICDLGKQPGVHD